MLIPKFDYTPREVTATGVFRIFDVEANNTFLNIGMKNPEKESSRWWIAIAKANGMLTTCVEIHPKNAESLRGHCDSVISGDIRDITELLDGNRVKAALWWHGPEHLEKPEAEDAISQLRCLSDLVVIGCPAGMEEQGPVGGNEHERHLSSWGRDDFVRLGFDCLQLHDRGVTHNGYAPPNDHITAWAVRSEIE